MYKNNKLVGKSKLSLFLSLNNKRKMPERQIELLFKFWFSYKLNKLCLFWKIKNNKMKTFESGKMIEKYWLELENKFENLKLHNFVVMPNHFYWILEIVENKKS